MKGERCACKCAASEAQHMQSGSKNELRNMRGRTEASQRWLLRATVVRATGASETIRPFESHLNTALPHVQRSRVPRSRQLTAKRVGTPSYVCCMLCVMCSICMLHVVCCLLLRCYVVVCHVRCVRGRASCVCLGERVGMSW